MLHIVHILNILNCIIPWTGFELSDDEEEDPCPLGMMILFQILTRTTNLNNRRNKLRWLLPPAPQRLGFHHCIRRLGGDIASFLKKEPPSLLDQFVKPLLSLRRNRLIQAVGNDSFNPLDIPFNSLPTMSKAVLAMLPDIQGEVFTVELHESKLNIFYLSQHIVLYAY
jgi:hypothetical protein